MTWLVEWKGAKHYPNNTVAPRSHYGRTTVNFTDSAYEVESVTLIVLGFI